MADSFVNTFYTYSFTALNNAGAVTWALNNGTLPPGMALSPEGVLSGTPTTAGNYNWNMQLTDGVSTTYRGAGLNVYAVQITSPAMLLNATQNASYTTTVGATATGVSGCCTFSLQNSSLPNGLTLNPNTGVISGTVQAGPGPWNFTLTATAGAVSYSKQMVIDIIGAPPQLPGINWFLGDNNCSIGVTCSLQVPAQGGGIAPYTWSASGLPPGMSVRSGEGVTSSYVAAQGAELWGTPTAEGTYTVELTITDSSLPKASATIIFPLKVSVLTVDGSDFLPYGTIGVPYSKTLRVLGGNGPYTVSQLAGAFPDGLSFNAAAFLVSGTPLENGNFNTAFQFNDSSGNSFQVSDYYSIGDGSSTITVDQYYDLGTPLLDTFYDNQLTACCASAYTWSFAGGQMPPGLTISPSGVLSGTLTAIGTYTFLIKVADASNPANTGFRQFVMTVTPISFSFNNFQPNGELPYGNVGTLYSQTLTATGGTGALTWTLFPLNYLPPGLSLASNGTISGTPTEPGLFSLVVTATDTAGNILNVYLRISIYPAGVTEPLNLPIGPNLGTFTIGGLTFELQAVGGTPPYTYSITPGAPLIPGMRVVNQTVPYYFQSNVTGGYIGVITAPGTYSSSLRVTDANNKVFDQPITLTISPLNIMIADGNLPHSTLNTPYTFTFPPYGGSGNYTWSANNLPPGMGINSSTGQLTGTPTLTGYFYPQITLEDVTNSTSITQGFNFVVDPFAITTDAVLMDGTVNVAYSETLLAPGCGSGCTWTLPYNSLPGGLSLSSNGVLSGSPEYSTSQFFFTVQASGSNGTVEKLFSIQINASTPEPLFIAESSPIVCCLGGVGAGQGYELFAEGGTPPYSWSLTSGSLPTGITIQGPGETISSDFLPGVTYLTGKSVQAGTYNFTLQVQDSMGATSSTPFTWSISPIWMVEYGGLPLPNTSLTYNVPYTQQLLAMGGTGNYTWANLTPMPPGLSITAAGVINGTPTNTGFFNTQIQVADTDNSSDATSPYINFFVAGPTSTEVYFGAGPNLGIYQPGYTATINLFPYGGTAPYTITALSALPPGFALESGDSSPYGGYYLVGQPLAQGTFSFTLQATDLDGNIGVRTFTLTVAPFTLYTSTQLADGSVGTAYSQQLVSFDSTSSVSWSIAPGSALPPGLGVSSAGVISGTPTAANYYGFQLNATAAGLTIPYFFSIRISNIAITNAQNLQQATEGAPYSYTLTATGNVSGLTWSASNLPYGLSMSAGGVISGTTYNTGVYWTRITATDGTIPVSVLTPLYVNAPNPTELDYSLQNTALPDATVGASFSYNLIPDGGVPPYSWIVALVPHCRPG